MELQGETCILFGGKGGLIAYFVSKKCCSPLVLPSTTKYHIGTWVPKTVDRLVPEIRLEGCLPHFSFKVFEFNTNFSGVARYSVLVPIS